MLHKMCVNKGSRITKQNKIQNTTQHTNEINDQRKYCQK